MKQKTTRCFLIGGTSELYSDGPQLLLIMDRLIFPNSTKATRIVSKESALAKLKADRMKKRNALATLNVSYKCRSLRVERLTILRSNETLTSSSGKSIAQIEK